jgi:hypothetical protein
MSQNLADCHTLCTLMTHMPNRSDNQSQSCISRHSVSAQDRIHRFPSRTIQHHNQNAQRTEELSVTKTRHDSEEHTCHLPDARSTMLQSLGCRQGHLEASIAGRDIGNPFCKELREVYQMASSLPRPFVMVCTDLSLNDKQ